MLQQDNILNKKNILYKKWHAKIKRELIFNINRIENTLEKPILEKKEKNNFNKSIFDYQEINKKINKIFEEIQTEYNIKLIKYTKSKILKNKGYEGNGKCDKNGNWYNPNTKTGLQTWLNEGNTAFKCSKCNKMFNTIKRCNTHQKDRVNKLDKSIIIISSCKDGNVIEVTRN